MLNQQATSSMKRAKVMQNFAIFSYIFFRHQKRYLLFELNFTIDT